MRSIISKAPQQFQNEVSSESLQKNALAAFESDYPVDIRDILPSCVRIQSFWKSNLLAGLFLQTIIESVDDLPVSDNQILTEYLEIEETFRARLGFWCNTEDWDMVYDDYIACCTNLMKQSVSLEQLLIALLEKYSTLDHKSFWQEDALGKVVYQLAIFHVCTHFMRTENQETPGADTCWKSQLTDDLQLIPDNDK